MNQLTEVVKSIGLEPDEAEKVLAQFDEFKAIASEWDAKAKEIIVTDDTQTEMMAKAREGRLFLKQTRIALEKTRKRLKERSLREGQAIQTIANTLKELITPIEQHLDEQEHFIEIRDKARKDKLEKVRISILQPLNVDYTLYNLREMPNEDWLRLVESTEKAIQDKIDEEHRLEEERIEREKKETAERERVMAENEKLRKEARERESKLAEERAKVEAEQKLKREAEEKVVAERKAKEDAERKAEEAKHERELALRREKTAKEAKAKAVQESKETTKTADELVIIARKAITNISQNTCGDCEWCDGIRVITNETIKQLGGWLEE